MLNLLRGPGHLSEGKEVSNSLTGEIKLTKLEKLKLKPPAERIALEKRQMMEYMAAFLKAFFSWPLQQIGQIVRFLLYKKMIL